MDPIFGAVKQNLDSMLGVPFVSSAVTLGLAFYAYKAAPELPSFMEELFLNVFFQIFVGFMVLYMTTGNFMLSLVVSAVFIYGMKMLSNVKEGMFGGNFEEDVKKANKRKGEKLADLGLTEDKMEKYLTNNKMTVNDILTKSKKYIDDIYNEHCIPLPEKNNFKSECNRLQKMSSYFTTLINQNFTELSEIIKYIENIPVKSRQDPNEYIREIPYIIYTILEKNIFDKVKNSDEFSSAYKQMTDLKDSYPLILYFNGDIVGPAIRSVYYKNADRIF